MSLPLGIVEDYGGPETYSQRVSLYSNVIDRMASLGLQTGDVIVDVGAGYCDFDMTLRTRGWFGRYVPIDGYINPNIDLETWEPFEADFFVCLDTVEHLKDWSGLIQRMKSRARKGVLVSTPDASTVDVFAMHETHLSALYPADLVSEGLAVSRHDLGQYHQMVGMWGVRW